MPLYKSKCQLLYTDINVTIVIMFCLARPIQERERYASPHKAYIYNIRGYESPVGPVKVREWSSLEVAQDVLSYVNL